MRRKDPGPFADRALVVVFRPYKAQWIQPFVVFAGKHTVSGIVMKALIVLEEKGSRVLSTVCNGSQSNASMWAACNISSISNHSPVKTSIPHPTTDTLVFFLRDAPRLMLFAIFHSRYEVQLLYSRVHIYLDPFMTVAKSMSGILFMVMRGIFSPFLQTE